MRAVDTVVVGGSAGGIEAITELLACLPKDFEAAILVVVHISESARSMLPTVLDRAGPLPCQPGEDGAVIHRGHVYVAPPGRHMLVHGNRIRLVAGPRENSHRPAVDPLFRSAARSRKGRVASVVMSGVLDDGTIGSAAVRSNGGIAIAQDPLEAQFPDMPNHAITVAGVEHVHPVQGICELLVRLTQAESPTLPAELGPIDPVEMDLRQLEDYEESGHPSEYVCPECTGTLYEVVQDGIVGYRCRVGHAYTEVGLAEAQEKSLEAALWAGLRAIKENNSLLERMITRTSAQGFEASTRQFRARLAEGERRLELMRSVIEGRLAAGVPVTDG